MLMQMPESEVIRLLRLNYEGAIGFTNVNVASPMIGCKPIDMKKALTSYIRNTTPQERGWVIHRRYPSEISQKDWNRCSFRIAKYHPIKMPADTVDIRAKERMRNVPAQGSARYAALETLKNNGAIPMNTAQVMKALDDKFSYNCLGEAMKDMIAGGFVVLIGKTIPRRYLAAEFLDEYEAKNFTRVSTVEYTWKMLLAALPKPSRKYPEIMNGNRR